MSPPIDKTDLVAVWGLAEVNRWAKSSDANVTTAIAKAWSEIRSAALNKYSPDSFDALTSGTLPDIIRGYAVDLSVDWLSSGNRQQGEIDDRAARARQWLGRLATGFDHSLDGVVNPLGTSTGSASARVSASRLRFDPDDCTGGLRRRIRGV